MKFNVQDTINRAVEEYGLGKGQYFKVQEGSNKIRLLSPALYHQSVFKGNINHRFVAWILDRKDNQIKLYFMPQTIMNAIGGLQLSDDFGFDEVPMPYDINIIAKGAGTKEVEYAVVGARQNTPLTAEELTEFQSKPSIDEVIEKLKEKQGESIEQPQTQQDQSGYEKARSVANSLASGNRPVQSNIEPSSESEDVDVSNIPF